MNRKHHRISHCVQSWRSPLSLLAVIGALVCAGCNSRSIPGTTAASSSTANQIPIQNDATTHIAGYRVPTLQKWERETTSKTNRTIQSVRFNKTVDGTRVMMKFVIFPRLQNAPPDTAADLAKSVQEADRISKKMGENKQTLLSQATQYRGYPAYMTRTVSRKGQVVVESQILRVVDGKNTFWLFQSLSGKKISQGARSAATQGWQTITKDLK